MGAVERLKIPKNPFRPIPITFKIKEKKMSNSVMIDSPLLFPAGIIDTWIGVFEGDFEGSVEPELFEAFESALKSDYCDAISIDYYEEELSRVLAETDLTVGVPELINSIPGFEHQYRCMYDCYSNDNIELYVSHNGRSLVFRDAVFTGWIVVELVK